MLAEALLVGIVADASIRALGARVRASRASERTTPQSVPFDGRLTVILPIFGLDADVLKNVPRVIELARQVSDVRWRFCLSWRDSSALPFIEANIRGVPSCSVRVSPPQSQVSDKNWNMLVGLAGLEYQADAVAFLDIDNELAPQFPHALRDALGRAPVVTSTTLYIDHVLPQQWWALDLPDLFRPRPLYLWAGMMAFRLSSVPLDRIRSVLLRHVHDDLPLTDLVRSLDVPILFAPLCVGRSRFAHHPERFLSWALRLAVFGKYGLGVTWWRWLLAHVARLFALGSIGLLAPAAFPVAVLALTLANLDSFVQARSLYRRTFGESLEVCIVRSVLAAGTMVIIVPLVNLVAACRRSLTYRGVRYSMGRSP